MITLVVILHVFVCLFLIFVVLIQSSKGAEIGAAFGGSTQTLFGSRGAATFLNKLTTIVAIIFMLTSLSLAILTTRTESVITKTPIKAAPVKPFSETTSGPVQSDTGSGQPPAQNKPVQPAK